MEKLTTIGRIFLATALVGLGVEHLIFGEFVTGRAPPWPAAVPGGLVWASLTGIAFVAFGSAILAGKHARLAAVLAGALICAWALLRHIPVIAADSLLAPTWTLAGKALTLFGGAWAIAATLPPVEGRRSAPVVRLLNARQEFLTLGRVALGIFLIITGIQHFRFTEFVSSLVPAWIPGSDVFWTYFAGVALIAGGIGLLVPWTARLAALLSGGMVFSWFWIVHIPRVLTSVSDAIAVFEALAVSGIAFVLAGSLRPGRWPSRSDAAVAPQPSPLPVVHT